MPIPYLLAGVDYYRLLFFALVFKCHNFVFLRRKFDTSSHANLDSTSRKKVAGTFLRLDELRIPLLVCVAPFVLCVSVMIYYLCIQLKSMGKIVLFLGMVFISTMVFADAETVVVNHINDVTHIEIAGLGANDYSINKKNNTIELKVSHLGEGKLAALKAYKDKHILSVDVQKSPALDQDIVVLKLASKDIEMFDYLTDAPSSLSIDLYYDDDKESKKASSSVASTSDDADEYDIDSVDEDGNPKTTVAKNKKAKKDIKIDEKDYKKVSLERELASDEFAKVITNTSLLMDIDKDTNKKIEMIRNESSDKNDKAEKKLRRYFEAKNPLDLDVEKIRFPIDILVEARDKVYLRFPTLLNESEYLKSIVTRPVVYEVEEKEDVETKDFIKAKKMFDKKDFKAFFKSKKILNKKYPKSKYTEMLSFMGADALLTTYAVEKNPELLEQSLRTYDALIAKYPGSPIAERTHLLIAYIRMKENKFLDAARSLKTYVELYKSSPLRENIKLILAQSLMRTRQYRDAGMIYEELSRSQSADVKEAANFEKGDVFLEKKDYENAIKYYQLAISEQQAGVKKYPNIYFNLAESQFLSEEYKPSLKSYRTFIEQHPQHPYSAYAWTRIGEILEIAEKDESVWRGFYNESIFRFNNEEGARIARVHLIRQDAPKAPSHKLPLLIEELKSLASTIRLPYVEDFIAFQIADIYYARENYKGAVDHLMTFFKDSEIPIESEKFHRRIGRALAGLFAQEIDKGSADSGIQTLKEYDELWLKKSKMLSFDYYKGRIYEKAGMNKLAESYLQKYISQISNIDINQTSEKLPTASVAYLFLTRSQLNSKKVPEALANLDKIKDADLSDKDHTELQRLKRDISIARNDYTSAEGHAKMISNPTKADYLSLAAIYEKLNNSDKAVEAIDQYVNQFKPTNEEKFDILKTKIDYLSKSNNTDKYKSFLKRFYSEFKNSKKNFDKEKYELSKFYMQEGNAKDANEVMGRITKNSIWDKLAAEHKEQQNWDDKYKKYIDRVPAMKSKEEGK